MGAQRENGIAWTDRTWNPVTGCTKVSAGCKHCYAEVMAKRTFGRLYPPVVAHPLPDHIRRAYDTAYAPGEADMYERAAGMRPRRFTDVQTHADRLDAPLRWRKPARVFVNSMSDLFHEDVPDSFIDQVFAVMGLCPQHTFQVLTKRPERMRAYCRDRFGGKVYSVRTPTCGTVCWMAPLCNVWLGVSVEDQATADARIPLLLQTPAALRFVSYEPALGPVDLTAIRRTRAEGFMRPLDGRFNRIDWVIVGGESGPKARPCDVEWIRAVVAQCKAAGVACFVKQLGANAQDDDGSMHGRYAAGGIKHDFPKLTHPKGGDADEWPHDLRLRQWPEARS